jgi:hypothetical protein
MTIALWALGIGLALLALGSLVGRRLKRSSSEPQLKAWTRRGLRCPGSENGNWYRRRVPRHRVR